MKKYLGIALLIISLCSSTAYAVPLQLQQTIEPLDCTLTVVSNGSGTSRNSDCPPQQPVITSIEPHHGRPIIRGLYDAANSQLFRVFFTGRWYVLNTDVELSAYGNVWVLDLTSVDPPLDPGIYQLEAEMTALDDTVTSDSAQVRVQPPPPEPSPVIPSDDGLLDTGEDILLPFAVAGCFVVLGTVLLVARRRRVR